MKKEKIDEADSLVEKGEEDLEEKEGKGKCGRKVEKKKRY